MSEIFTHECDGCGARHESRESTATPAKWLERRIQEIQPDKGIHNFHVCSLACWVNVLRKEADRLEASISKYGMK